MTIHGHRGLNETVRGREWLITRRGFTLMEVLIVLVIVGILASLALQSWHEQVLRAQRAEAQSGLLELAGWLERNAAGSGRYDLDASGQPVVLPFSQSPKSGIARYALTLAVVPGSYLLSATPITSDLECGVLSLDATGVQGASGTLGNTACWNS